MFGLGAFRPRMDQIILNSLVLLFVLLFGLLVVEVVLKSFIIYSQI
jgi:hypothetical protein